MAFHTIGRGPYGPTTTCDIGVTASTAVGLIARLEEVLISGLVSGNSAVNLNQVRRDSSNGGTPVAITPTRLNPRSATPVLIYASSFASNPNLGGVLLNLGLNAFGGLARWAAQENEEKIYVVGNTAGDNELSLTDALAIHGTQSAHMVMEEL